MHYRAGLLSTGSLLRRPSQLEHKMTTRGGGPRLRTSETVGGARPAGHAAGHSTRQTPNHAILDAAFHAEGIAAVAPGLGAELVLQAHPVSGSTFPCSSTGGIGIGAPASMAPRPPASGAWAWPARA